MPLPACGRHVACVWPACGRRVISYVRRMSNVALRVVEAPALAAIPAGWFLMGSPEGQGRAEERPVHRVWVDSFEMGRRQVTNRDYARFLKASGHLPPSFWSQTEFSAPDQPVVGPSWFDAMAYCDWLSRETSELYRLLTEAEWERAARGGAEGCLYPWGDTHPAERPGYSHRWKQGPEPAATAPPNAYGLFDICENVHEWCLDWYHPGFYATSPERNPVGAQQATSPPRRASRGGSWRHHIKISRCAARSSIPPEFHYADYGFRIVRSELRFAGVAP